MPIIGVWACMVAFDVFTVLLAVMNSYDRPYRHQSEVLLNFRRDGALFFLVRAHSYSVCLPIDHTSDSSVYVSSQILPLILLTRPQRCAQ